MGSKAQGHAFYQNSLQAIEQALYQVPHFPFEVSLGEGSYQFDIWTGQRLTDRLLAFDTETTVIKGHEIPNLALATVFGDAGSAYVIHPDQLAQFVLVHHAAFWCCHNAPFDFWVVAKHLRHDSAALTAWWDIPNDGRLCCTMLLDQLIGLARIDAEPLARDLGEVAREYCGLYVDKDDPYRLRYSELLGLPADEWPKCEPGFFQYACKDPIATFQVMRAEAAMAQQLIAPYQSDLLPDAWRKYGPLTACLQTQGAIALDHISRNGISVDVAKAKELHIAIGELVRKHMARMEQLGEDGQLFKRYKRTGEYQTTKSGGVRRNSLAIKSKLEQISKANPERIRPPRVKNGTVTDAASFWEQHVDAHPFIAAYVNYYQQSNLLKFSRELNNDRVYPRYRPLVRTGRTSCSKPNLQQLPRDGRFRKIIIAPPGYQLLQIDYSTLELCTLAAICLHRFKFSRLAELLREGIDPHKYTAALLLDQTLEQFSQRPPVEQKQHRQRAKALNFGIPGGLGTASLVGYAKHSYGVELTFDEARQFRNQLVKEIYPELSAYLADQPFTDLAANLQCMEIAAHQAFPHKRQIRTACRIVAGETETEEGTPYEPDLFAHIWLVLSQVNRNAELQPALEKRTPSPMLSRRVFWGHAVTISGRLRGHVGYTQRANSPFQSLAADGNKLALFRLLRAGYQLCGFVHDEMLVLIPNGTDYDAAVAHVQQIMIDSMQELTPGVPIETEYLLADRWYKCVDEQPKDTHGRIIPYTRDGATGESHAQSTGVD